MGPGGTTVVDLVEAGAARDLQAIAAVAGGASLTFGDLDARANRLARHLRSFGVGPDVTVAVCLDRGLDMAVALQGVLKAGGACVPLDPTYPPERLAFMADDAAVAAVVTRAGLVERLSGVGAAGPVVRVDADAADWADRPALAPPRTTAPEHLAYVIYTSGSTGRPKGVMLTNRGLVNHHRAAVELYRLAPGDRVLQFCSIGFDASIEEMFPTWAAGATVVFRPEQGIPLLGRPWLDWLRDQRVSVVNLPTAYWHAWAADLEALDERVPDDIRLVVVGGEKASGPAYATWARVSGRRRRWINVYGPTETTCMSTFYEPPLGADIGAAHDPPIGRPLPGTTVVVVDDGLRPVAAGVTGELLIGGAGLARGYLNRPELTIERFVDRPADPVVGGGDRGRMYRTGDLVRELPGGDLDYVGRIDDQVKIQGYRIECGEVEAALARHPAVAAVAVVARDDPPGDKRLVAYVVATRATELTTGELRRFLAERVPAHMAPATFTVLDDLPLTPNGKVDRAALPVPAPTTSGRAGPSDRSGSTATMEERVAAIWARVLGVDAAGLRPGDDFFDLGGHSLLATQVVAQVREEFGTETPLRAIFEAPTLAGLSALVGAEADAGGTGAGPAAGPPLAGRAGSSQAPLPLSLAQEQMWVLETSADPPGLYNVTALHRFDQPVDLAALRVAIDYLVDRHETLRTGVAVDAGRPYQFVVPADRVDVDLDVADLRDRPAAGRPAELQRRLASQDAMAFDLARPPLFRVGAFALDDRSTRLAVTFDHLISDGTGAAVFVTELLAAYRAVTAGDRPALPPLEVQFGDFAVWQRAHVGDDVLGRQLDWWKQALEGMPRGPALPFDRVPTVPTRRIASRALTVPVATRARLDDVAQATDSTVFVVVVAAVHALLGRHGRSHDVVVSTTLSGRGRAELEGLVGMFSGISRIRTDLSGDPSFATIVRRAREHVLGMFENQDIPFMGVRRAVMADFPTAGPAVAAALPVDLQFFHTAGRPDQEFFFRGQLHPLSITLLDDGAEIAGELSYKLDFYLPSTIDRLAGDLERLFDVVGADPSLRLSQLPISRT